MHASSPSALFRELRLPPPFHAVISTRVGGLSPEPWESLNQGASTGDSPERVARNRALVSAALGIPEAWAHSGQVHGTRVLEVSEPGHAGEADGLWTERAGLVLAIRVADCAAVALAHPSSGRLGLVHAGWRGAAAGAVGALLQAMEVPAGQVHAAVAPHLGPCCFEVGPDVVQAFGGRFTEPRSPGKWTLDLGAALEEELLGLGIPPAQLSRSRDCTSCERGLFYSHRRDHGRTGRMAALAWREAAGRPAA